MQKKSITLFCPELGHLNFDSIRGPVRLSVCLSIRLFQLASYSSHDVIARRRSDYCPRGAIFKS